MYQRERIIVVNILFDLFYKKCLKVMYAGFQGIAILFSISVG